MLGIFRSFLRVVLFLDLTKNVFFKAIYWQFSKNGWGGGQTHCNKCYNFFSFEGVPKSAQIGHLWTSWADMIWLDPTWSGLDIHPVGSSQIIVLQSVKLAKTAKIGHLRPKYVWIQLDRDWNTSPHKLSVIFWWDPVGSSQKIDLQSVKWAKTAKLGDLAHFELFWGQNMAGCNLIWIKIPSLVYCQWFLVEIQLVPAKKLVFRVSNGQKLPK